MNGNEMLKKLGRLSEITSMKDVRQLTTAMFPGTHCPLMGAAMAVRGGMEPEQALAAITRVPAEIAGIAERVGTLTPGKDADIVVTQGHPFAWDGAVRVVFLGGKQVK